MNNYELLWLLDDVIMVIHWDGAEFVKLTIAVFQWFGLSSIYDNHNNEKHEPPNDFRPRDLAKQTNFHKKQKLMEYLLGVIVNIANTSSDSHFGKQHWLSVLVPGYVTECNEILH